MHHNSLASYSSGNCWYLTDIKLTLSILMILIFTFETGRAQVTQGALELST